MNKVNKDYLERVGDIDINDIIDCTANLYNLEIDHYNVIEQGYEDLNLKLVTNKGKFLLKVFNKERKDDECSDIVNRFLDAKCHGVSVPSIFLNKNKQIITNKKIKDINLKLFLMEFINGSDFTKLGRTLVKDEIYQLVQNMKKLNQINNIYKKIYNAWEVNNFAVEYENSFDLLDEDIKNELNPIYNKFKLINFDKLPIAYIHGDINSGNTMKDNNGQIILLDFCTSNYSNRINELLTICGSSLIIDTTSENNTKQNINAIFNIWCQEFNATELEKKYFPFLLLVQTALNYLQAYCENKKGNQTAENFDNLKEDYFALKLTSNMCAEQKDCELRTL